MPQRYNAITPMSGANLYQVYAPAPAAPNSMVGSQVAQLGISPGVSVNGNLNTRWLYAVTNAAVVANTATNIDPATFLAGLGSGGVAGKSLVAAPTVGSGAWFEISGATLNLAQLQSVPARMQGESEADFKARVVAAHAAVGENPDGTPLHPAVGTPLAEPHAKADDKAHDTRHDDKGAKK
jgi:hypothetical protein